MTAYYCASQKKLIDSGHCFANPCENSVRRLLCSALVCARRQKFERILMLLGDLVLFKVGRLQRNTICNLDETESFSPTKVVANPTANAPATPRVWTDGEPSLSAMDWVFEDEAVTPSKSSLLWHHTTCAGAQPAEKTILEVTAGARLIAAGPAMNLIALVMLNF